MLCRALLALASIRHKWKAPGATRACALRSLPAPPQNGKRLIQTYFLSFRGEEKRALFAMFLVNNSGRFSRLPPLERHTQANFPGLLSALLQNQTAL